MLFVSVQQKVGVFPREGCVVDHRKSKNVVRRGNERENGKQGMIKKCTRGDYKHVHAPTITRVYATSNSLSRPKRMFQD